MARIDYRAEEQLTLSPEKYKARPASLIKKNERTLSRRRGGANRASRRRP